jgi:hypothetical protein
VINRFQLRHFNKSIVHLKSGRMRKNLLTLGALVLAICGVHAFSYFNQHGISGKIKPAEAAQYVWAIAGKDSTKTTPVQGSFLLSVKPGDYQIYVDAKDGYKDVVLDDVKVALGKNTDLGEILVEKVLP